MVILLELDGSQVGGTTTQTITGAISGDVVTLDGNFGGSLATGKILAYAESGDSVGAQLQDYVYYADVGGKIGATTREPWQFGET